MNPLPIAISTITSGSCTGAQQQHSPRPAVCIPLPGRSPSTKCHRCHLPSLVQGTSARGGLGGCSDATCVATAVAASVPVADVTSMPLSWWVPSLHTAGPQASATIPRTRVSLGTAEHRVPYTLSLALAVAWTDHLQPWDVAPWGLRSPGTRVALQAHTNTSDAAPQPPGSEPSLCTYYSSTLEHLVVLGTTLTPKSLACTEAGRRRMHGGNSSLPPEVSQLSQPGRPLGPWHLQHGGTETLRCPCFLHHPQRDAAAAPDASTCFGEPAWRCASLCQTGPGREWCKGPRCSDSAGHADVLVPGRAGPGMALPWAGSTEHPAQHPTCSTPRAAST